MSGYSTPKITLPYKTSDIVLPLKDEYNLRYYVETGTFAADGARWAASHFKRVYSIEILDEYYQNVKKWYSHIRHITFVPGDSRVKLREVLSLLDEPALVWLDAHFPGNKIQPFVDGCPLREELQAVAESGQDHFILIDDAWWVHDRPPDGAPVSQWPDFDEVRSVLSNWFVRLFWGESRAFIVAVPSCAQEFTMNVLNNARRSEGLKPYE